MSETILLALILLACPIGMGLMMWHMGRYQQQNQPEKQAEPHAGLDAQDAEAVRLRAEIDQLKAAQRDSATHRGAAPPHNGPPAAE
ncbi:hypothetical protein ABZ078_32975 [Streptomyces sp. NPDC006385]|uniref:hypothetical protein n=1 Tax=Streptomyces sp. NPDC006385 TaxID=3156761 RepID=UPI0033BDABCA